MKRHVLFCYFLLIHLVVFPQKPVHWQFSAESLGEGKYNVKLSAKIDPPWHIYSQMTPADGPQPTIILFKKNPLVSFGGKTVEHGDLKTVHDETFGVDVRFFSGQVEFVQELRLKGKARTSVTGSIEFMACTDTQCLRPQTIPFSILLAPG